ncbi:MAG: haloacid dehalogenase-like hydrolase [bacterium]|nr:haloacid dehalogenase-like hydrolase [bacterium]
MKRLALFDLDFTLLPHDTMFLFANYVLKRRPWRLFYLAVFAPFIPLRVLGFINEVPLKRAFFSFLWRMSEAQVDQIAKEFVQAEVVPRIYPEMLALLKSERELDRALVLNTASPNFFARYIAEALDFDHCFATPLQIPDRVPLLPRFTGPNNKGRQKITAMRAAGLLTDPIEGASAPDSKAGGADPADSSDFQLTPDPRVALAATDSTADLPMLAIAERGLLIHPDHGKFERKTGRKIAGFSHWTIQEPARPYSGRGGEVRAAIRQMLGLYPSVR